MNLPYHVKGVHEGLKSVSMYILTHRQYVLATEGYLENYANEFYEIIEHRCLPCVKRFPPKVVLSVHTKRMHAGVYQNCLFLDDQ